MVQNIIATELGKAVGNALYNTQLYKDDFIDTEEVTNIDLYMGETLQVTGTYIVSSRALPGSAFILDHPVYSNLDYDTNLKAYFKLEGNANDSTVNANNGTVTSATLISSGITGSCYSFNGSSNYITLTDTPYRQTTFSISMWLYPTAAMSNGKAFSKGNQCYSLGLATSGFEFAIYDTTWRSVYSNSVPSINSWYHVVATWSQSDLIGRMYVNGVLQSNTITASYTSNSTTYSARLGANPENSNYWQGRIDEVSYFSRRLSQSEVTDIYNSGTGRFYPDSTVGAYGYHLDGNYAVSSSLVSSGNL